MIIMVNVHMFRASLRLTYHDDNDCYRQVKEILSLSIETSKLGR